MGEWNDKDNEGWEAGIWSNRGQRAILEGTLKWQKSRVTGTDTSVKWPGQVVTKSVKFIENATFIYGLFFASSALNFPPYLPSFSLHIFETFYLFQAACLLLGFRDPYRPHALDVCDLLD